MTLSSKSLTELRGIAQNFGVKDIFQKDKVQLIQAIEQSQEKLQPAPKIEIPKPEYDARLMTKIPARKSDQAMIEEVLAPYIARGLKLTFPEPETWAMSFDKRTDTGTMRMPPRIVMRCADRVLYGK